MDRNPSTRREYLLTVGATGVAALAGCSNQNTEGNNNTTENSPGEGTTTSEADNWPQTRYDAANIGIASDETGPSETVNEEWRQKDGYFSPLVVSDGTVYAVGIDGNMFAIDTADGTKQWTREIGNKAVSTPAVDGDTVYVWSESPIAGGVTTKIYAFETDGTERWNKTLSLSSSPTVVDGTIYVQGWGHLVALDASDGTEQWAYETNGGTSTPAVVDGTVYVGGHDNNTVHAVDAVDGTEQWTFETAAAVESAPAVNDGTVYIGDGDGNVYALDTEDGTEQWSYETGDWVQPPAVASGVVYIGSGDNNLYALDAEDGTEQWSYETGDTVQPPSVADGIIYIGSEDNNLYALDAEDGTEQWSYEMDDAVDSEVAVVDGTLYVCTQASMYALTEQ